MRCLKKELEAVILTAARAELLHVESSPNALLKEGVVFLTAARAVIEFQQKSSSLLLAAVQDFQLQSLSSYLSLVLQQSSSPCLKKELCF